MQILSVKWYFFLILKANSSAVFIFSFFYFERQMYGVSEQKRCFQNKTINYNRALH